jgi:EmrB/QacA subfamily drug resistance transporter
MDLVDSSALATAVPTLARIFKTDPLNLKFALTSYLLTIAVLVPASGWLSNRIGSKQIFMIAMAIFLAGTACCGLSNSLPQLVAARVLQGVGGSMMTPVGRSIVVASMPRAALVNAMALFTLPAIVGPLIGPALAGYILEYGNWRWIFYLNIPVGLVALLAIYHFVPKLPRPFCGRFDGLGFLILAVAITISMTIIETSGFEGYPPAIRALAFAADGLLFSCYWLRSRKLEDPVIDLRLLRIDTLRISLTASWLQRMPVGAMSFLLPLLLQTSLGISPLKTSQVLVAMAVGSMLTRVVIPPLLRRLGFKDSMLLCGTVASVLTLGPLLFNEHTPMIAMMAVMGLVSVARSSFFIPAATLAYADISERQVGHVSVLFTVSQQLSYAMGISVAAKLLAVGAGGGAMIPHAFVPPFLALAIFGALSLLIVWPMRRDAGNELRGLKPDSAR